MTEGRENSSSGIVERINSWLFGCALPTWSQWGLDREGGGFFETLTFEGRGHAPDRKRLRVQARQIFVFCKAVEMGWQGEALSLAKAGLEFMTRTYWNEDEGGWMSVADRSGRIVDASRDPYDHAFVLFALASLYALVNDKKLLGWIDRTLDYMDENLYDPDDDAYQMRPRSQYCNLQNPHMHLLEALLALFETTGKENYLDRASRLVNLFQHRMFDSSSATLGEYFSAGWTPVAGTAGSTVEPGHHYEWVWLLHQYARLSGKPVSAAAEQLFEFANTLGIDSADGLAWDAISREGKVLVCSKRLWPQTERLKALTARHEVSRADHRDEIIQLTYRIFDRYCFDTSGLWQDRLSKEGGGLAKRVPASVLYHIILAMAEVKRVLTPEANDLDVAKMSDISC